MSTEASVLAWAGLRRVLIGTGAGDVHAWGFTIGDAIFEGRLPGGPGIGGQVLAVLEIADSA
jgi:hypothetical protein